MRKPESFRGPGKVPGRVLRKPGKTGGPEKFRVGLDIFNIYLLSISKRFQNKINIFNIYGLPLTWKAQVGGSLGGASWKLPPFPPWRNPRRGTLGRSP